ncbi:MAG: adenylosuccinate lyase [candidate division WOR-3 bacterium]
MAIHPIDGRYGRPEVKAIFEEENKLQRLLDVECALVKAQAEVGNIPKSAAKEVEKKCSTKYVKVERVKEIEDQINHDLMAMVKAFSEQCGDAGKYIHLGATSADIMDTSLALQLRDFLAFLEKDLYDLRKVLVGLANKHKKTACIGRTHAQHAVPTTYGLKFAIYAEEVQRHIDRLNEYKPRILVGQMTGAVGTQAALGQKALKIQELTMKYLGLKSVNVSNQVIQRDRHAEFLFNLALIGETLNKIMTEIRNLQRTEIDEVAEGFERGKQVGSSTMPHKRNPIMAERICGLSRILRADAFAAMDNIALWHERDLTNSAPERFIIPEACIVADYMLAKSIDVLKNLEFKPENIKRNLNMTRGLIMAENVMMALVDKGMGRQEAHELVRKGSMKVYETGELFIEVLRKDPQVAKLLSEKELKEAMDPERYIGTAVEQVEAVVKRLS